MVLEKLSGGTTGGEEMWNIIIWGTGEAASVIAPNTELYNDNINIIGYADSYSKKWGKIFQGKRIYSPLEVTNMQFDSIVISSEKFYDEISSMLIQVYKIKKEKIDRKYSILRKLLLCKYKHSSDKDIVESLEYLKLHKCTPFNQYVKFKHEPYFVEWDKIECLPYILFEDKKMYYPSNKVFQRFEGKEVIFDLMAEQGKNSPHLYINDKIKVDQGDVICDAGVCEGNFALKYVEKASKIYLIECDEEWFLPLAKTFEPFKDKVEICHKFLGRYSMGNYINIDTLIEGRLDFLKMDIEGAEVEALLGSCECMKRNNVKSSICSYHRHNDEIFLKNILEMYGYETFCSNGYMTFLWDEDMYINPEFRRGIVYGIRGEKK